MNPITGDREDVQDEWVTKELCLYCDRETDHRFLLFVDEPIVESECTECDTLRVHPDRSER